MARVYSFTVEGQAAPQGSFVAYNHPRTGKAMMKEASKRTRPYRALVTMCARTSPDRPAETITGPCRLYFTCFFPRPAKHFKKDGTLRDDAPAYPITRQYGDLSKLQRAIEDSLTDAEWWKDDSLVISTGPIMGFEMKEFCPSPAVGPTVKVEVEEVHP